MDSLPSSVDALPVWNFDGSSTGQAVGHDSDIYMKPVSTYRYVCVRVIDQQESYIEDCLPNNINDQGMVGSHQNGQNNYSRGCCQIKPLF